MTEFERTILENQKAIITVDMLATYDTGIVEFLSERIKKNSRFN